MFLTTATTQPASDAQWRRLRADVRRLVSRRLSNPADQEDVVQEVMVRVWRHGPELRDQERFGAWLMRLVYTATADHFRQRATRPEVAQASADDADRCAASADSAQTPERLKVILADILRPFIDELPDRYRDVTVLSELEDLPHAAIADRLGLSLTAVKSRVQRARKRLRRLLEDCCRFAVDGRGAPIDCEMRSDASVPGGFTAAQRTVAGCRGSFGPLNSCGP
jgi:RNA polymerase sigma-70 factor, ECF subfamily